jgi:hypothetical protein
MEQILTMKYGTAVGKALSAKIYDSAMQRIIEPLD